jgi:GR25 family glycosyltransferase involved in LPS biosynthesis
MKSKKRFLNYHKIKKVLSVAPLQCFEAIDSINEWDKYYELAKVQKTHDLHYLKDGLRDGIHNQRYGSKGKGELGCDLSHLFIYNYLKEKMQRDDEYCLILEDDISLDVDFNSDVLNILEESKSLRSNYVHMLTNKRFKDDQYTQENRLTSNLYRMIPQWHTGCQLISRKGAAILIDSMPFTVPVDIQISDNIDKLNATASPVKSVRNHGCTSGYDKSNTKFGSLIWQNKE